MLPFIIRNRLDKFEILQIAFKMFLRLKTFSLMLRFSHFPRFADCLNFMPNKIKNMKIFLKSEIFILWHETPKIGKNLQK